MIGKYLDLQDVKNLGLVCKKYRESSKLMLSKKSWIKLKLSAGSSFSTTMEKFCREIYPLLIPKYSKLKVSVNVCRYKYAKIANPAVIQSFQIGSNYIGFGIYLLQANSRESARAIFYIGLIIVGMLMLLHQGLVFYWRKFDREVIMCFKY